MSQVQISVPEYLRPPCEHLWKWQDHGDAAVWCRDAETGIGESTAAFAPQLMEILQQLHERLGGLPPLTSVLAVIDACSNRWIPQVCVSRITRLTKVASRHWRRYDPSSESISSIWEWLAKVHRLPSEQRCDVESQIAILSYALQDAPVSLMEATDLVARDVIACVSVFASERDPAWVESAAPISALFRTKRVIETLQLMSGHEINAQAIRLWRETNVDSIPPPAPVETPISRDPISRSLKELSSDEQWGAVARSAITAASMLSLPRRPSDPDQLPIGGVSDVSNRGQPERLLITELAQDPMVMLARIANGQALYLRRETPPGPSPDIRPVFLESGIRTWGGTRLRIASIAMAVAAAEERRGESTAKLITVAGNQHFAEDFTSAEGIIAHLQRMKTDEHPGEAIANYLKSIAEQDEAIADPIVVVSAATDADERFRRTLAPLPDGLLVARVERDQTVTLLRRTPLGDESLQSLSLKSVDAPVKVASSTHPIVRTKESSLALFLDLDPCPLRFTDNLDGGWFAATTAPGLFTITRDKRLLWFGNRGVGGVQLIDRLPHTSVLAYERSEHQIAMVVGDQEHFLVEADAINGCVDVVPLSSERQGQDKYEFDNGSLFCFGRQVQLFDRQSGAIIDRVDTPKTHIGAAVLADGQFLTLLAEQAGKIVSHEFHVEQYVGSFALATRDHSNTIVLISNDFADFVRLTGDVPTIERANTRTARKRPRTKQPRVVYRSAGGELLVVSDEFAHPRDKGQWHSHQGYWRVDLQRGIAPDKFDHPRTLLYRHDPSAYRLLQPRNFLSRFSAIEFDYDHSIGFVKQDRRWRIVHSQSDGKLSLTREGVGLPAVRYGFAHVQRLDRRYGRTHWSLRPIAVGNNHVVADSRGLVHLRRGDDGSELTLVLHQDHVSGWASWGELFGDGYYLGGATVPVSETVLHWLEEFASQCSQSS